ncbi:Serine/threonine-protein kinase PrkC [Pirellulimonas nuda]|uniref:Serine/threonine-protein kinase PrkC n=1 Tax=Pirellulimonas nuda TaxID=2528009 RepID=A0A518D9M4_9BACT|nr:serine/threonine-protein kinase [Pirellulimonas nuda]QDU88197.1 Serine/threonine-protein kinase PrkC [Pirellulimonas nuda]
MTRREADTLSATTPLAGASQDDADQRLAELLDRYLVELELTGVPPDIDRLAAGSPDLIEALRRDAQGLRALCQMTAGMRKESASADLTPPAGSESPSAPGGAAPRMLGDFLLDREIGRGGMGIVYEARQQSLGRRVALKVLPFASVLDERQIARFRTEAQAAAQLHHPHIVPVYAVGEERGVHYYAMQLVAGQSLEQAIAEMKQADGSRPETAPVSERAPAGAGSTRTFRGDPDEATFSTRVSVRSRGHCRAVARLGVQAAGALQHAHEYGVVHRDIKPSNLLIDRSGKLWITDFGLARVQTGSSVTVSGDVLGTLRYMSPEQAHGNGAGVDARTDVFALGATLYEMLTLTSATRGKSRQQLLTHLESGDITPPRQLNPGIPFDLETIVMRALAKARDERYPSAQELADDLRRFLAGESIHARRPTLLDRAAKWAFRRRRMVAVAAAALVLVAAVSIIAGLALAREGRRTAAALDQAEANLARAETHYRQAREVVDRLGSGLADRLAELPAAAPLRQSVLADTLRYYREFIEQAKGDAMLRRELVETQLKAGVVAYRLGDYAAAETLCRDASSGAAELVSAGGPNPSHADLALAAQSKKDLGAVAAARGDLAGGEAAYASAIAVQRLLLKSIGPEPEARGDAVRGLAETYTALGLLLASSGDHARADRALGDAVHLLSGDAIGSNPDNATRHALAVAYNNRSYVRRQSDAEAALADCGQAIELLRSLAAAEHAPASQRRDLALSYNNRGALQGAVGDWPAAASSHLDAIELLRTLVRQAPAVVDYRRELAVSWSNRGQALGHTADVAAADDAFSQAETLARELVEDQPSAIGPQSLLAGVLNNRAMLSESQGRLDDAAAALAGAIEHQRLAFEAAPQVGEFREQLSKHYSNYARVLWAADQPADAARATLARSRLWPDDSERLRGIASEVREAARRLRDAQGESSEPELIRQLVRRTAEIESLTQRLADKEG